MGAKKVGLNAKGIKCEFEYLKNTNKPFIAHVIINNSYQHYIVVYKITKSSVKVMDPMIGFKTITKQEFIDIWDNVIIILYPNTSLPIIQKKQSLKQFIIQLIKPYKKQLIYMFIISIIINMLNIIGSYYFQYIIDAINSINNLYVISIIFLISIILKILSEYYRTKISIYINKKIEEKTTLETVNHVLSLPYKYYKNKTTGDILTRICDLNYIKELIEQASLTLFMDILLAILTSIFLIKLSLKLFIISIIVNLLYSITVLIFNKILFKKFENNFIYQSEVNSYLIESINSYETIKGININKNIYQKFKDKFLELLNSNNNINKIINIEQILKNTIDYIGSFTILFFGAILVINQELTLGMLVTYNAIFMYFTTPIKNIVEFELMIKKSLISLKRLNELYDIEKEEKIIDESTQFIGNIKINKLSYSYTQNTNILNNINLNINIGDKVIITGNSGSGKSTLMKLIMKNYNCNRGKIFIDGIDINDYKLGNIRKNICYVSQQELLYNDTVFNNLNLDRNKTIEQITKICKITNADKIIEKNPLGMDMIIEENGFNLSGGERQRIILSRTLLSNFKILILDESTNQIDIYLERKILTKMIEEFKNKTIIFISHRKNNTDLFDYSINFDEINKRRNYS